MIFQAAAVCDISIYIVSKAAEIDFDKKHDMISAVGPVGPSSMLQHNLL